MGLGPGSLEAVGCFERDACVCEAASASSTFASGNLVGSPEYNANNALSPGSGYWCSAGSHSPGETVTWTARLSSARSLASIQVNWAHGPRLCGGWEAVPVVVGLLGV